jgi:hypothetical protein
MMFLKSLQWFEWLLIGCLVAVLGVSTVLWNKYDARTEQAGSLKTENSTLTETVKYKDQSATISDQVVTEFVQEKEDVKEEMQQSREGVIDEYINMATSQAAIPTPVVDKPKAKVATRSKATQDRPTTKDVDPIGDAARIGLMADRLHQHYCAAAPERGVGCSTISANH